MYLNLLYFRLIGPIGSGKSSVNLIHPLQWDPSHSDPVYKQGHRRSQRCGTRLTYRFTHKRSEDVQVYDWSIFQCSFGGYPRIDEEI